MSQPETPLAESWRYDPKIRFAVQVLQFFVMVMLAMLVFVQKHNGEKAVVIAQQKAYQTESELNREIYDLKTELAKAQARIKELEKAAAK
jgi:5-bromo-4-chloroindolyl phosphate hydrolysis protein